MQVYQDAQDKQPTQYQITPKSKWRTLRNVWNIPSQSVQTSGWVYHDTVAQLIGPTLKNRLFIFERNLYGHPLAGIQWERQYENICFENGWEKVPNWKCLFVHRQQGLFLSVHLDDIKLAGKTQNHDPMWKTLRTHVDLGKPTSFSSRVLGMHSTCKPNQSMVDANTCSNRESLQEHLQSYQNRRNMVQTLLRGPTTWKDMQRNALNGSANWQTKQIKYLF